MQGSAVELALDRKLLKQRYWFDAAAADHFCDFCSRYIRQSKGKWQNQPLELAPWQVQRVRRLFGWRRPDGTRRYRRTFWFVPRKNGKSTIAAAIALYLTTADGELGAGVFCAANSKEQAAEVFAEAKNMAEGSPVINSMCEAYKDSLFVPATLSRLQVISSKPSTAHGKNVHGVVIDEIHEFKTRELYDVLTTASSVRDQPLECVITTAGQDQGASTICTEIYDYACKVRDGIVEDPEFMPVIFEAGEDDDWTAEETFAKANPMYGITISRTTWESEVRKAKENTGRELAFKRLFLNRWTQSQKKWLDSMDWNACAGPRLSLEQFAGRKCWGGLDLSKTTDLSSLVLVFPREDGGYDVVPFFWCPAEQAERRSRKDRVPYVEWIRQGHLRATEGNVVDYRKLEADIVEISKVVKLQEIAYDRYLAATIVQNLQDDHGITMVEFGQGFVSMAAPSAELERLVIAHRIRHGAHPILRWMASHVVVRVDPAGNMKPDKEKSRERIDGIVGLVMAIGRAMVRTETTSVYEERGLRTL